MQRLFSMFPPGGPGIGLLLLRNSVAATSVFIVANQTGFSSIHPLFIGTLLASLCLTIGAHSVSGLRYSPEVLPVVGTHE